MHALFSRSVPPTKEDASGINKVKRAMAIVADNKCGVAHKSFLSLRNADPLNLHDQSQMNSKHPSHDSAFKSMSAEQYQTPHTTITINHIH
jgi:hypothetical protein